MRFKKLVFIDLFLKFCCVAVFAQETPQYFKNASDVKSIGFDPVRLVRIDSLENDFVSKGITPNAVTFVARKGQIVHYKAFGMSNLEKKKSLKKDDIFRIASQSKALTTVALLQLFEQGKFHLDDPLYKFIPSFKNPIVLVTYDKENPKKYTTRPAKSEITIRQLLSHNTGIPYGHPLEELPEFKVPLFCSTQDVLLEDVVNKIAKRPLIADPGTEFTYGLNTDIAGRLIEVLSGKSFDVYLNENVIRPIGMKDTYFYLPDSKKERLVELYSKERENTPLKLSENEDYRNFAISGAKTYFSGGAGLVSTIEDYAKFCQFILNGGVFNGVRLLSPNTVAMMVRNQIGSSFVWDRNDKFGLGFQIIGGESHYGDNATPNSLTWGGMYCSEFTIDKEKELVLLVFTNITPFAHYGDFVRKFRIAVYQALVD